MISARDRDTIRQIYPVSNAVLERLELYVARLAEWQRKTNLIAPSTLDDIWVRHIADSLQCISLKPDARTWLDLGSGGGFPGLVIAAVMADHDDASVTLVESNNKKTSFLCQVNRQMGAAGKVITSRIEHAEVGEKPLEIVTARALTALPNLLALSKRWIEGGATGLFHKGREYEQELAECDGLWSFDLVHHSSRVSPESVILEISNLMQTTGQAPHA